MKIMEKSNSCNISKFDKLLDSLYISECSDYIKNDDSTHGVSCQRCQKKVCSCKQCYICTYNHNLYNYRYNYINYKIPDYLLISW